VCNETGVKYQEERIPHLKNREREKPSIAKHYSKKSKETVGEAFEYEINRFGYSFPEEEGL
jgi:hypothetical protein